MRKPARAQARGARRRFKTGALALAGLLGLVAHAPAANLIKVDVDTSPGGVTDIVARLVAETVGRRDGPTMVVENRIGAGGVIGTEFVARATPDGTTLLATANPFVINPVLRKTTYDAVTSFEPICIVATAPTVIAVPVDSPYKDLGALIEAAREKPGAVTFASVGPGSPYQIGIEQLKRAAKIDATFVPYPGNGPSLNALLGRQVAAMFGSYANVSEQVRAGAVRLLAVTTAARIPQSPDTPTVAERGFPGYEIDAWFGALAPARTPPAIMTDLISTYRDALQAPVLREKLAAIGLTPSGRCGADFRAFLQKQSNDYRRAIADFGIKAE